MRVKNEINVIKCSDERRCEKNVEKVRKAVEWLAAVLALLAGLFRKNEE